MICCAVGKPGTAGQSVEIHPRLVGLKRRSATVMSVDKADRLLVNRIRHQESAAWEELIARFEGRLLAFVTSRLGDRTAAEDVVQETLIGFLVSLPNYDETTPLESWLFAIAAHKLTDALRRRGRRPAIPVAFTGSSAGITEPPGPARRASSLLRSRERHDEEHDRLAEALRSLTRTWIDRGDFERLECIELLFVLGWSNKAVADRLGISEQKVANHKHYVIGRLKRAVRRG